jgi:cytochrome c oxidase cbb3-type subunit 2
MPAFPWLFENTVTGKDTAAKMKALRMVGVPYTDEDIANAAKPFASGEVKEIDALVVYLQQLGTLLTQKR